MSIDAISSDMRRVLHDIGANVARIVTSPDAAMRHRAARLWPESEYLQREWLRAVSVVRKSPRGWLIERQVRRA